MRPAAVEIVRFAFAPWEAARLARCLARLTPHVQLDRIAISGGVAMDIGLAALGRPRARTFVADLDLVASSVDAVHSGVVGSFLVSHYHVARPAVPKFMIQLVDPLSRIRIDIFPDLAGSIAAAAPARIGEHWLPVLPLGKIFEYKLQTLLRASPLTPIDPKHLNDALALGRLLSQEVPHVQPEALVPDVYGGEADGSCERCVLSQHPLWPLASKDVIDELLGWRPL